jgi:glycosyltransferase involved in cell wall biosynthesis
MCPVDIIHCFNSHGIGLFCKLLAIPQVVTASCFRPIWNNLAAVLRTLDVRADELLEALFYRLSANIYSPRHALKDILEKEFNRKDIAVIRTPFYQEVNRLDESVYSDQLADKTYLLYFGRLQQHKGAHILGDALPEIFNRCPDITAVFIGLDGISPDGGSMRNYLKKSNCEHVERLIFIDALRHEQLYPVIQHARLVVLPSLFDNLPNVLLEAMGLGRPVLGTSGCSFDEFIEDGINGFLAAPGNAEDLAKKILTIWDYSDRELAEIGQRAQKKITELAPEKTVQDVLDYYQSVLKK